VDGVMKFFDPLTTHPPFFLTAVVRVPEASEPALGSVKPHAPNFSPRASGTRYFCFCSSVPNMKMWFEQSELCAATEMPTEPSTRESSSMMATYST
jgi:hypothetical protein